MIEKPRWQEAKLKADELTKLYSMPPIPVHEIAEQNGVEVVFADFSVDKDVFSGLCDFKAAKIYVNRADSLNRQLFTIAHELGHWLLHKRYFEENPELYPALPRFSQPDNNNPMEKEANYFAANLLVPQRLIAQVRDIALPAALAQIFSVSRTMMEYRLKNV